MSIRFFFIWWNLLKEQCNVRLKLLIFFNLLKYPFFYNYIKKTFLTELNLVQLTVFCLSYLVICTWFLPRNRIPTLHFLMYSWEYDKLIETNFNVKSICRKFLKEVFCLDILPSFLLAFSNILNGSMNSIKIYIYCIYKTYKSSFKW